jgi:hypothetical protein
MRSRVIEKIRRRITVIGKATVHLLGTIIVRPFLGRGRTLSKIEHLPELRILYVPRRSNPKSARNSRSQEEIPELQDRMLGQGV